MNRRPLTALLGLSILLCAAAWLSAGPLDPPGGAVSSTYKTLTEVEPRIPISLATTPGDADSLFRITSPGSYYLTGNITGVIGKHGIEIAAGEVTIDLNGFALSGVAGMGAFSGIIMSTGINQPNITIRNGTVRAWGAAGIDLATVAAINTSISHIHASFNAGNGIVGGVNTSITNCQAIFNGGVGISAASGGLIADCTAYSNSGIGISASSCTVSNCFAQSNAVAGISAASGSVIACTATFNTAVGIAGDTGTTITNCTAVSNTTDGIRVGIGCLVMGNSCRANGASGGDGAGIHATGADNRIENNNCLTADRGIDIDSGGNVVVRNTCSGNTNNWDVVAGNLILVVSSTTAGAVMGNAGGAAVGSTDPNANFTY